MLVATWVGDHQMVERSPSLRCSLPARKKDEERTNGNEDKPERSYTLRELAFEVLKQHKSNKRARREKSKNPSCDPQYLLSRGEIMQDSFLCGILLGNNLL